MTVDLSTFEAITRLAEQFGPFLFAILFILVVTRTARGYYVSCMTRKEPPPSKEEQKTYRLYFLCSVWVGIVVMALSIGWWVYAQAKGNHVYQVAVVDLGPDELVLSDYYFKTSQRPSIPGANSGHDTYFLIVQDQPFKVGETFEFDYFKLPTGPTAGTTGVARKRIEIKYSGNRADKYRVIADAAGTRLEVVAQDTRPAELFTAEEIGRIPPRSPQLAAVLSAIGQ
jgi:hypothetical protein